MSEKSSEKDYDDASLKPIPVPGKVYPIKSDLVIGRNIAKASNQSMQPISKDTRKTSLPIHLYGDPLNSNQERRKSEVNNDYGKDTEPALSTHHVS